MRVVNIEPKDIHVTFEMSVKEINMTLDALENAEIKFDGDEPKAVDSTEFLKNTFFKLLNEVSNDIGK